LGFVELSFSEEYKKDTKVYLTSDTIMYRMFGEGVAKLKEVIKSF
jgi:hypothetical protein